MFQRCLTRQRPQQLLHDVRRAADTKAALAQLDLPRRNAFLHALIKQVNDDRHAIFEANRHDVESYIKQRSSSDRYATHRPNFALTLNWIDKLLEGIEQVAALPDVLGARRPFPPSTIVATANAAPEIVIEEVSVPMGVIGVVSRFRPRILLDAIAMGIKSGNAVLVDSGSTVWHTSHTMMESVRRALATVDVPQSAVVHLEDSDERQNSTPQWLQMHEYVDMVIVCGSNKLHEFVAKNTMIPVVRATGHVCTLYIDKDANYDVALEVVLNAKIQRVNATNAINNLLIHRDFERTADLLDALALHGVNIVGDHAIQRVYPTAGTAAEEDWRGVQNGFSNFHKLCVKSITKDLDEVVEFLSTYGSRQSDGIISHNPATVEAFLKRVDSAVVYANASTRFSSGESFGVGADLAVATSRLHCRGPISLGSLTTKKFVVRAKDMSKGAVRKP